MAVEARGRTVEYKGYQVIARASWRPAGYYKCRFAVYRTTARGTHEIVYQGVIASPDYTAEGTAEAHGARAARDWIDRQARKQAVRAVHREPCTGIELHTVAPHSPIGFAYG